MPIQAIHSPAIYTYQVQARFYPFYIPRNPLASKGDVYRMNRSANKPLAEHALCWHVITAALEL
jgi:hypothetical protein